MAKAGELNELLLDIIRVNVRDPVQVIGDLLALSACNQNASEQLDRLLAEFELSDVEAIGQFILDSSAQAMRSALSQVPAGEYQHSMTIDGYNKPVDLRLKLTLSDGGVDLDFSGTSEQSDFGINVPLCYSAAYASFGLKCALAPEVPNNAGSLGLIQVRAPEGSILNAQEPAAVTARHVIGQMLPDLVFGCLYQVVPDKVPAEGTPLWLLVLSGLRNSSVGLTQRYGLTSFHNGGTGARPGLDGLSATSFPSGIRSVAVEIVETLSPLLFVKKELRTDSGGVGQWRGGLGQTLHLRNLEDQPFQFSAMLDRVVNPPRGRDGGGSGKFGVVRMGEQALAAMGIHQIPSGSDLVIETPGGGGLGDAAKRDREAVMADLKAGYISKESANTDYQLSN